MIENIKEQFAASLEPIATQIKRLSTRERLIVYATAIGVVLFLAIVCLIWAGSASAIWKSKVKESQQSVREIAELGTQYVEIEKRISSLDAMISQAPSNFQLATELESIANQTQIQIDSINDRPGPPHEYYTETQVILSLKEVELLSLIEFLQAVENSNRFMLISNLNIKPGFKDPTKLTVQAIISTFAPM